MNKILSYIKDLAIKVRVAWEIDPKRFAMIAAVAVVASLIVLVGLV